MVTDESVNKAVGKLKVRAPSMLKINEDKSGIETPSAHEILAQAAQTYRERNAVYGSNFRMIGPMMKVLFPDGVPPDVLHSDQFHLFELVLVKISRLAISGLTHEDSARDACVYCAMIESIIREQTANV